MHKEDAYVDLDLELTGGAADGVANVGEGGEDAVEEGILLARGLHDKTQQHNQHLRHACIPHAILVSKGNTGMPSKKQAWLHTHTYES